MLSGANTITSDNLIQGICFINNIHMITIIDTGATHSFIYVECMKRLNLEVSAMSGSMVINTHAMGSVTMTLFCLKCPLSIFGRDFRMDMVCLPLV